MRLLLIATAAILVTSIGVAADTESNQYFELREYRLKSAVFAPKVDKYLTQALAPALARMGAGPVGVFREDEEQPEPVRFVLIPFDSIEQVTSVSKTLAHDQEYQRAAADYLATPVQDAPLSRIRSELLYAFNCQSRLHVDALSANQQDRIFELRTYESPTEQFGDLKVEMFNSGEVPIFLDCGIQPVFLGQAIVGDKMPSLTYMTIYSSTEAKDAAWKKFPTHPDWIKLKGVEKYKGSVSKIYKWDLVPVAGSQL
jgi:hypothetical protein